LYDESVEVRDTIGIQGAHVHVREREEEEEEEDET
jgi:hypothetical protein